MDGLVAAVECDVDAAVFGAGVEGDLAGGKTVADDGGWVAVAVGKACCGDGGVGADGVKPCGAGGTAAAVVAEKQKLAL